MDDADELLVERAHAGDDRAFSTLVSRHRDRVYRVALGVTRDEARARDAVQETFVQVFRRLDQLREGGAFHTWLNRVTINAALMRVRAERRHHRAHSSLSDPAAGDPVEPVDEAATPVDEAASLRERGRDAAEVLAALREPLRTVFVLRELEELTTSETAARLSVTEPTVKTRLSRARVALRRGLEERWQRRRAPEPPRTVALSSSGRQARSIR